MGAPKKDKRKLAIGRKVSATLNFAYGAVTALIVNRIYQAIKAKNKKPE